MSSDQETEVEQQDFNRIIEQEAVMSRVDGYPNWYEILFLKVKGPLQETLVSSKINADQLIGFVDQYVLIDDPSTWSRADRSG